jgi:uncharacterized membrane protein
MTLLILGLLLFAGVHLTPSLAPDLKTSWHNRLGESGYKGTFALLLLLSFGLIIMGWRGTQPELVYPSSPALRPLAMVLLGMGFVLFVVSNRPSRLRQWIRHPQLTGLFMWALAHLLLNGDNRSLVLFTGMGLWAVVEIIAINRREGVWIKGEAPGLGTEIVSLLIAAVVIAVLVALHPYLSGKPVF